MSSRLITVAALAAAVPLALGACADTNVSKSQVSAKLKSDPRFSVLNDKQRDCIADLMMKKGSKADMKKWVDGKKKLDDVRGDSTGIQSGVTKCTTAG